MLRFGRSLFNGQCRLYVTVPPTVGEIDPVDTPVVPVTMSSMVSPTADVIQTWRKSFGKVRNDKNIFISNTARLIGQVKVGLHTSFYYNSVVRADLNEISIGDNTNVQDNCVIHVSRSSAVKIGNNVSIGHACVLHGCTIEDNVIIGMGSIIMDNCIIRANSVVGAGSLVTANSEFPENSVIFGRPAKCIRETTPEERQNILATAERYVQLSAQHWAYWSKPTKKKPSPKGTADPLSPNNQKTFPTTLPPRPPRPPRASTFPTTRVPPHLRTTAPRTRPFTPSTRPFVKVPHPDASSQDPALSSSEVAHIALEEATTSTESPSLEATHSESAEISSLNDPQETTPQEAAPKPTRKLTRLVKPKYISVEAPSPTRVYGVTGHTTTAPKATETASAMEEVAAAMEEAVEAMEGVTEAVTAMETAVETAVETVTAEAPTVLVETVTETATITEAENTLAAVEDPLPSTTIASTTAINKTVAIKNKAPKIPVAKTKKTPSEPSTQSKPVENTHGFVLRNLTMAHDES